MAYVLRDYQQQASDAAVNFFHTRNKRNGLLVVPTGGGKSLVIADIAARLDGDLLVFQPSKEILEQNYAKLRSYGVEDCSIYSASFNSKKISRITFATIGSVKAHMEDFNHFKYILVDEAHCTNAQGGMYKDFFDCAERKILGLTATPYRLSATSISLDENGRYDPTYEPQNRCILKFLTRTRPRIFHDVIYQVDISTLLQRGYLARMRYFDMSVIEQGGLKRNTTGMDYDDEYLIEEYKRVSLQDYLVSIINRLLNPKSGQQRKGILVFTKFLEESEYLARQIDGCAIVSGTTPKKEREAILKDFKAGRIRVVSNVGVLTCLSEDTEILTRNKGWVGVNDIELTDDVAQYENEIITFANPIRIINNPDFDEDFVEVNGRYTNMRVTHNHKILYAKRSRKGLSPIRKCNASDLAGQNVFIPVSGIAAPSEVEVPVPALPSKRRFINYNAYNYRKNGMSHEEAEIEATKLYERRLASFPLKVDELTKDDCLFIGFWLGDGCLWDSKKGGIRYAISQSTTNPCMVEWIECLLGRLGISYTKSVVNPPSTINGRECNVKHAFCYNLPKGTGGRGQYVETRLTKLIPYLKKDGSELYWGFSREQYFWLMEGFFKANGYHGDNSVEYTGQASCGSNKKLFDLLQAIGVCRGYRVSIMKCKERDFSTMPLYRISLRDKRYHQLVNDRLKIVPNNTKHRVWCVTMPKGTIITRRNGRVSIMGNCGFDYPELDTVVMARPTMSLALYYQIIGRAIRPHKDKSESWFVDLCGNIKKFGRVEDLHLSEPRPGEYVIQGYAQGQWRALTNVYF